MYRSASTNRVLDDHHYGSSSSASSKVSTALRALSLEVNYHELPLYNNNYENRESEAAKRERYRAKFAENAVHLIPLVLLSCAFILWLLCNPDIDLPTTIVSKAATTIEGDVNSYGTQSGNMPLELDDLSKPDEDPTTFFSARSKLP